MPHPRIDPLSSLTTAPVRSWFEREFPAGPTPAQALAWPLIATGENVLLISPTGTGKTLAAFLAIVDRLHGGPEPVAGLRCVYVSPLRSLGYDVERNLVAPLEAIRREMGREKPLVTVGVRTGDTSAHVRRSLRDKPPHILITTPESLSLMLAQASWDPVWKGVEQIVVDEIHALAPSKRGADLMASIERLSARSGRDPTRIGLSATCRPAEVVARFLVGPSRECRIVDAPPPPGEPGPDLRVESLIRHDEAPHRALSYRRLLKSLRRHMENNRTTIVFANTRALTEKITHDLRNTVPSGPDSVAAHHSALDAKRRREVEAALKGGELRGVVTSTSLELGVDIGTADLTAMVGLPGSASRCLQRVGRSGHRVGARTRGVILAASAAEIAGAVVTVAASVAGRVEPLIPTVAPLDVLCQQLIGMACGEEWSGDAAYELLRKSSPFATLSRADFDSCLDFLAGELSSPPGAFEPEPSAEPRWTAPRIWKERGRFAVRNRRVIRWFLGNVGTINAEESVRVVADGREIGSVEAAYAERLQNGDRFVLDGRSLEFRKLDGLTLHAVASAGEPELPRWSSDRQSLSPELARDLAVFRDEASRLLAEGGSALRAMLVESHGLDLGAAAVVEDLIASQDQLSEVPPPGGMLVEDSPDDEGRLLAFHVPLARSACEALGRAVAARLGRRFGRDVSLAVADLGFAIRVPHDAEVAPGDLPALIAREQFEADVLDGLDRGGLAARRFRHVAATALMVLRRPDGGKTRVGGMLWVSERLYPLVKACCPDHPLLRETRREVLHDLLDTPSALAWIEGNPAIRFRSLDGASPFTAAWIDGTVGDSLRFESPGDAPQEAACAAPRPMSAGPALPRPPECPGWALTPEGAAIHLASETAVIADVHLGYEWARAAHGDLVPAHSFMETADKLTNLLERITIRRLIVAGDLVESRKPCRRTTADVRKLVGWLRERSIEPIFLQGNHDPPQRPPLLSSFPLDGWTILHGDRALPEGPSLFGHHHPALKASGLVAPCFLVGGRTIALPAFSPNAAGLDISTAVLPGALRREPLRCWAGLGGEILDFGPVDHLRR